METLKESFICDFNPDNMSHMFEDLFKKLHIMHFEKKYVPQLSMDNILIDDNKKASFNSVKTTDNIAEAKRSNIRALAKIMLGCYLSQGTLFTDLSHTDDSWFEQNLDEIFRYINYEDVDKEYFYGVFVEGKDDYYSDYLNRKRQGKQLEGTALNATFRKTLRRAESALYNDQSVDNTELDEEYLRKPAAKLHLAFNPLLIGITIAIIVVITIMIILIK